MFGGALLCCLLAGFPCAAEPLYSPAWGFRIDLPEGYTYQAGDGRDAFSFRSPEGAVFDLVVYRGRYESVEALAKETARRIGNRGDVSYFDYHDKKAALMELNFSGNQGWGLAVELSPAPGDRGNTDHREGRPQLLALAYNAGKRPDLSTLHLSGLDSIAPSGAERRKCGPVTEFSYPRGALKKTPLAGLEVEALIAEHDAGGARALVDREFRILRRHLSTPGWKEAWIRFYRMIYRDSWERLADAAFQLERHWNTGGGEPDLELAKKALQWVQGFKYERDPAGSDFVDLVSTAIEGRGDCDSRALLWAIILSQANIPASIMISREYSHAMGLADLPGPGARFEAGGKKWLVAETTARVDIGLIGKDTSDIAGWIMVIFEQDSGRGQ